jgi:hypothetical protein
VDQPGGAGAAGPVDDVLGAADVDVEELAGRAGRVDDRGGVEHRGVGADAVEQPVDGGRVAHVADHDLDRRRDQGQRPGVVVDGDEAAHPLALGRQGADQVLAQPAGRPGDDGGGGGGAGRDAGVGLLGRGHRFLSKGRWMAVAVTGRPGTGRSCGWRWP